MAEWAHGWPGDPRVRGVCVCVEAENDDGGDEEHDGQDMDMAIADSGALNLSRWASAGSCGRGEHSAGSAA